MNDTEQTQQQRTGKVMIYLAWIVFLGLLTIFFEFWLDKQENPNKNLSAYELDGPPEVVLQRSRGGHYVAPGFINGHSVRFLVDTGATDVNIPATVAKRIGLKQGRAGLAHTANGTITIYDTIADQVRLGNIALNNVNASINPHMGGDTVLLGMSFMKNLELIQRGDQLTLRQY